MISKASYSQIFTQRSSYKSENATHNTEGPFGFYFGRYFNIFAFVDNRQKLSL